MSTLPLCARRQARMGTTAITRVVQEVEGEAAATDAGVEVRALRDVVMTRMMLLIERISLVCHVILQKQALGGVIPSIAVTLYRLSVRLTAFPSCTGQIGRQELWVQQEGGTFFPLSKKDSRASS